MESDFTNTQNTIGGIYIVRDPRNVITSLKNHYAMNDEKLYNGCETKKLYL